MRFSSLRVKRKYCGFLLQSSHVFSHVRYFEGTLQTRLWWISILKTKFLVCFREKLFCWNGKGILVGDVRVRRLTQTQTWVLHTTTWIVKTFSLFSGKAWQNSIEPIAIGLILRKNCVFRVLTAMGSINWKPWSPYSVFPLLPSHATVHLWHHVPSVSVDLPSRWIFRLDWIFRLR